ncbi:HLJ1_G0041570.mRNA.1.CDS.1 [Saccharomyces cerevisiae]|nr:HLJ1_G0041570.mRNA.1.CDS.1 [Saccharomyces cerevisiae]
MNLESLLLSKRRLVSVLFDNYQGGMKLRYSLVPSTKILQAMEARNDIVDSLIINSHAMESDHQTLGDHEVRQCEDTNFGFKI